MEFYKIKKTTKRKGKEYINHFINRFDTFNNGKLSKKSIGEMISRDTLIHSVGSKLIDQGMLYAAHIPRNMDSEKNITLFYDTLCGRRFSLFY
jgi:hypothetical protein